MNSYEQRKQNDQLGLTWVNTFGSLRTAELGKLMWPNDPHARTRTDRVARSWIERGLVIARPLPDGAGRLLVLSEPGARLLRNEGIEARSGKDIGETKAGKWIAPAYWQHDLMAAGVLATLYENGYEIQTEREIRNSNPSLIKIPDGLAWESEQPNKAYWLEVENARKTGKHMQDLANALCVVSHGISPLISGIRPTRGLVALVPTATDERDYRLSHRARVTAAIQREAKNDVTLCWATCTMLGCGVARITIEQELIAAEPAARMMKIIRAISWADDKTGIASAHYGDRRFHVWEDDVMGWSYQLDDNPACQASSRSEALHGCARLLGDDLAKEIKRPANS